MQYLEINFSENFAKLLQYTELIHGFDIDLWAPMHVAAFHGDLNLCKSIAKKD